MPQEALTSLAGPLALLFALVAFSLVIAQAFTRGRLENRLLRTEVGIREADRRFADARAAIAAAIAAALARGEVCGSEAVIAIIGQASPPVSERQSAIENVNVGLSLK